MSNEASRRVMAEALLHAPIPRDKAAIIVANASMADMTIRTLRLDGVDDQFVVLFPGQHATGLRFTNIFISQETHRDITRGGSPRSQDWFAFVSTRVNDQGRVIIVP